MLKGETIEHECRDDNWKKEIRNNVDRLDTRYILNIEVVAEERDLRGATRLDPT